MCLCMAACVSVCRGGVYVCGGVCGGWSVRGRVQAGMRKRTTCSYLSACSWKHQLSDASLPRAGNSFP